jgi:hypothetical protein
MYKVESTDKGSKRGKHVEKRARNEGYKVERIDCTESTGRRSQEGEYSEAKNTNTKQNAHAGAGRKAKRDYVHRNESQRRGSCAGKRRNN